MVYVSQPGHDPIGEVGADRCRAAASYREAARPGQVASKRRVHSMWNHEPVSDDPISVPMPDQTEEQRAEQERQSAQADLIKELLDQLKPRSSAMLQQARSLAHEPSKDQLQSLADEIDQVAQAGRNAQGRMDSADCPKDSFAYRAIQGLWEHCDLAHRDAKQAVDAAGDNDEVRAVAYGNMMQNLDQADGQLQQA